MEREIRRLLTVASEERDRAESLVEQLQAIGIPKEAIVVDDSQRGEVWVGVEASDEYVRLAQQALRKPPDPVEEASQESFPASDPPAH